MSELRSPSTCAPMVSGASSGQLRSPQGPEHLLVSFGLDSINQPVIGLWRQQKPREKMAGNNSTGQLMTWVKVGQTVYRYRFVLNKSRYVPRQRDLYIDMLTLGIVW